MAHHIAVPVPSQAFIAKLHAPFLHIHPPSSASSLLFHVFGSLATPSRPFHVALDRTRLHLLIPSSCFPDFRS